MARQSQKGFIEIFSMPSNPFQTREDDDDIDIFGDECLEAHGAEIIETQTYFPESGKLL